MITLTWAGQMWQVASERVWDCSTPIGPGRPATRAFGLPNAVAAPFAVDGFIGDTRQGGSVNCETITVSPHGNGTHTECVGHIVDERIAITETLRNPWIPGALITIDVTPIEDSDESYAAPQLPGDLVLSAAAIDAALEALALPQWFVSDGVLAIRTRTAFEKRGRDWSGTNPPYLTAEATRRVVALGIAHLVLDVPSIDRESDEGRLANHHTFWGVPAGSRDYTAARRDHATITEMMLAPSAMPDGPYLFSLQVPPFVLDAAPSRVLACALTHPVRTL
jgi:arylformamidase